MFLKKSLTVSEASSHTGRGEGVALLRVDELTNRRQLVDLVWGGVGTEGGLRGQGAPGAERRRTRPVILIV